MFIHKHLLTETLIPKKENNKVLPTAIPSRIVCDYPTQIKEKFPMFNMSDYQCHSVMRSNQSSTDGWSWRNAGIYIGDYTNRPEYLYDSKQIARQWIFEKKKPSTQWTMQDNDGDKSLLQWTLIDQGISENK
jgi:hypothetical protein